MLGILYFRLTSPGAVSNFRVDSAEAHGFSWMSLFMKYDSFNLESPVCLLIGDTMLKSGYGVELAGVLNNLGLNQNCSTTFWFMYFIYMYFFSFTSIFVLDVRALMVSDL